MVQKVFYFKRFKSGQNAPSLLYDENGRVIGTVENYNHYENKITLNPEPALGLKGTDSLRTSFNYASSSEDLDAAGELKPTLVTLLHSNLTNNCGYNPAICIPPSLVLESVPNSDVIKGTISTA